MPFINLQLTNQPESKSKPPSPKSNTPSNFLYGSQRQSGLLAAAGRWSECPPKRSLNQNPLGCVQVTTVPGWSLDAVHLVEREETDSSHEGISNRCISAAALGTSSAGNTSCPRVKPRERRHALDGRHAPSPKSDGSNAESPREGHWKHIIPSIETESRIEGPSSSPKTTLSYETRIPSSSLPVLSIRQILCSPWRPGQC
ncbi:hypothetical protein B0T11DRAFT_3390 [Plectosphaerella cucumerina]|uniref:Uncharacterized protein n=1 Tax=Plectosphaerella cucumerina TaxID=40658 RepID=A0A8K0TQI2_9PEZI|nr:hypothetical protein B0T11DRAFT_3390 [Plectosphaerella cucumerina]